MTVRVERTFELDVPAADVWEFIADPTKRASAISVVTGYERRGDVTVWFVELPVVRRTIEVETRDVDRREGEYVEFVGKSSVLNVTGEHELEATDGGCRLHNTFVVEGKFPGVESFFKRELDDELDNLERELASKGA
ncbi:carbon monoxide dehydrogenase subunit G [Halarchaeum rubridurum]|uniref:Carbon monoxide dehydrogenase subunit G n=1 Tax=Halarchaeum rubridurum TaxID=489911 RepID=A0A830G2W8_9EURY|nr:SRPBCC family protein [Halarchaeum rubridurum]MBP1955545.1 carbon monoxide dehydrogenase subunit G [Halarchaeum rubridurum]GGM73224.1 polyketide cyclase [Halarchaeum rubridurum]